MRTVSVRNQKTIYRVLKRTNPQFEDLSLIEIGEAIYEHANQKTLAAY